MILKDLLRELDDFEICGPDEVDVKDVCFNSKAVKPGSLFVAIPGFNSDGRKYIPEAVKAGAVAAVFEGELFDNLKLTQIRVSGGRARLSLAALSAAFFVHPTQSAYLCGVTGTNGKTTLTYLAEALWRAANRKTGVIGTVHIRYGKHDLPASQTTPESRDLQALFADMRKEKVTHAAIEVSSHALTQARVARCQFDAAVFTNLTQDHLDFHGTMEDYYRAKAGFFTRYLKESGKSDKLALICREDAYGQRLFTEAKQAGLKAVSYGFDADNDIYPEEFALSLDGIKARLTTPYGELNLSSKLLGRFNLLNLMAACGIGFHSGLSAGEIEAGIRSGARVPGRMERVEDPAGRLIFVDYAHSPDALKNVLETIKALKPKKLVTVFGCGGDRDKTKRPLMGEEAARLSDIAVVTSDNPRTEDPEAIIRDILPGVERAGLQPRTGAKGYVVEPDRKQAIAAALSMTQKGEVVLIAGKGHEDYQIIGTTKHPFSDQQTVRDILGIQP